MMDTILLAHAQKYPQMEPQDAVKLLYQSQFGGGHLIQDEAACLERLHREYSATPQSDAPLWEDIGNGMVRIMLSALDAWGYPPAQLGQDFIRSASSVPGSMADFLQALSLLEALTRAGKMPFSEPALHCYLSAYAAAGYPIVSHSEAYRNAYHPAYRVLHTDALPDQFKKQV